MKVCQPLTDNRTCFYARINSKTHLGLFSLRVYKNNYYVRHHCCHQQQHECHFVIFERVLVVHNSGHFLGYKF